MDVHEDLEDIRAAKKRLDAKNRLEARMAMLVIAFSVVLVGVVVVYFIE